MEMCYGVIGGDRRQAELARLLRSDGKQVVEYGFPGASGSLEQALKSEVVLLPLPLCRTEGVLNCGGEPIFTRDLFACFDSNQKILAGQVKEAQHREAAEQGIRVTDYFAREELTIANAAITAEAAIQVAMENLDRALLGLPCLVLGFGRIGKLLSHRLHGMGALVTAAARRSEDLAWIRAYGYRALKMNELDGKISDFALVYNTAPSLVLNDSLVKQLPGACLCIDLASQPGIDREAAGGRGLRLVWARSLPGRMAPRSAAEVIRDAVYHILSEE